MSGFSFGGGSGGGTGGGFSFGSPAVTTASTQPTTGTGTSSSSHLRFSIITDYVAFRVLLILHGILLFQLSML